ncbi:PHD finger protein 12-like isoform X2 [Montipora foliosa]|uniref:PHD finger protein 12-like isoform X2 n=1 Tax=Montipora foliosa TaxID=591990 RepID=UPI0035F1A4B1
MDYDHLDPEGSLMDRIQALIQPPQSEESSKKVKKVDKEARKQGRSVNNDNCDSCGEGGDLLCCDRCPCAFHLTCCDPPLEEDDIPDGEWLCNECKATPKEDQDCKGKDQSKMEDDNTEDLSSTSIKDLENSKPESPFSTLVKMTTGRNPTTFTLPPELKCNTFFPGDRKRKNSTEERAFPVKNGKRNGDEEEHTIPPGRLCFACSRSELIGELVHCDFCPLAFHMDCLNPPLTTVPSGMWMCPNHAEHAEPGLREPRFSKRLQAYNDLRSNISQHTIKMNFLQRVHRLKKHPSFKRKALLPTRRRATVVPQAIKDHYASPPIQLLPEHIRKMQEPLPLHVLPLNTPSSEEQEEWLKCVINLQCGIAKHLSQPAVSKSSISNHADNSSGKLESLSSNTSTLSTSSAHSTSTGSVKEPIVNGLTTKSDSTNHISSLPASSGVQNACISRVVTTTITTTSGGKTITKPLTILYASPSKLQTHMNGPLSAKSVGNSSSPVNVCSVSSTHLPSQVLVKQEPKSVEKQVLSNDLNQLSAECKQLSSDTAKLINEVGHVNNVKAKISVDVVKTVAVPTSSTSSIVNTTASVVSRTISTAIAAGSSSSSSATKAASSTPTKLIVLTSTNSGNIIKTIATAGLSAGGTGQLPGGSIVTLGAPGNSASINPVKIGSVNASTATSVGSSPSKVTQAAAATSAATANAINSICAAAGVDAFNELAKLDPRLIQVLAYQRLQQLLTQTKPVPQSPAAARKISFNGLKETIVLPQQAVPAGRSIAVLCPLSGTGPVCPMIHKCLSLGQGPDMDVCLQEYGHCNFISQKHCSIFYDETSKQYELINYSEHGTYVDNVLYSCDFSDKINRHVLSSKDLDPSKVTKNKLLAASQVRQNPKTKGSRRTVGLGVQNIAKACNCTTSSSNLIGGSGAGWEGTALLHHGSYIKLGCAQFVFSITSHATKLPSSGKTSNTNDKKPTVS